MELFSAIARCSGRGPRLVVIQLCRCLVAFAFATIPDVWPNTVVSMVHSLRTATQTVQVSTASSSLERSLNTSGDVCSDQHTIQLSDLHWYMV